MSARTGPVRVPPRAPLRAAVPAAWPTQVLGRRLAALNPGYPDSYGVRVARPGGDWLTPATVVAAMLRGAGDHLRLSPAVAGARLIGSLGYAALGRVGVAIAATGRAYSTAPETLLLQLGGEGLVERIAVSRPELAVPGDDPWRRLAGVTVLPDLDALVDWTAHRAHRTLGPLVEEVHEATGYGRQPLWNLVADTVLGPAAHAAALAGRDPAAAHRTADALLDALVARGALITRRGSLCGAGADGTPVTRRGACCLYYRESAGTCAGCPLTRPPRNAGISPAGA